MAEQDVSEFSNYLISKNGKIWSKKNKIFLTPIHHNRGYFYVFLYKKGEKVKKYIHRLLLETFVGPCPEGMECCHNDGNPENNNINNLRWDTHKNNCIDAIKHGTTPGLKIRGEKHGRAKLTEQNVRMIIYMWRIGGFTREKIAKIYNIGSRCVGDIINKRTWKHIWRN